MYSILTRSFIPQSLYRIQTVLAGLRGHCPLPPITQIALQRFANTNTSSRMFATARYHNTANAPARAFSSTQKTTHITTKASLIQILDNLPSNNRKEKDNKEELTNQVVKLFEWFGRAESTERQSEIIENVKGLIKDKELQKQLMERCFLQKKEQPNTVNKSATGHRADYHSQPSSASSSSDSYTRTSFDNTSSSTYHYPSSGDSDSSYNSGYDTSSSHDSSSSSSDSSSSNSSSSD